MTTATLDEPMTEGLEEFEVADCDFDMEDFFSVESDTTESASAPTIESATEDVATEPTQESNSVSVANETPPLTPTDENKNSQDPVVADCPTTPEISPSPPQEKSIYQQIWEVEHELAEICREEERLKAELKSVKESRIEMVEKLEGLCDERDNPTPSVSSNGQATTPTAGNPAVATSSPLATWGREPIEVLAKHGLTEAKVDSLRAAADKGKFDGSVCGLRDWIAKFDLWYRDVKGCGTSGADKIGDALTKYVAANPMVDEPMTAEDEARSVAAAISLGHVTSPESSAGDGQNLTEISMPLAANVSPTPTKRSRRSKTSKMVANNDSGEAIAETAIFDDSCEMAYLSGCESGASGASCSDNPFGDRSSPQAKEWHRGWEECSE